MRAMMQKDSGGKERNKQGDDKTRKTTKIGTSCSVTELLGQIL